jgi:hypothetical protein
VSTEEVIAEAMRTLKMDFRNASKNFMKELAKVSLPKRNHSEENYVQTHARLFIFWV